MHQYTEIETELMVYRASERRPMKRMQTKLLIKHRVMRHNIW